MSMMSAFFIIPDDLVEFLPDTSPAKIQAMIDDVFANVVVLAPLLASYNQNVTPDQTALVTSITRQAVIAYENSGAGALASEQESIGPFSMGRTVDSRQFRKGLLTGVQVQQLRDLNAALDTAAVSRSKAVEFDLLAADWAPRSGDLMWR